EITFSYFHDFIDKDLINLVIPDVRSVSLKMRILSRDRGLLSEKKRIKLLEAKDKGTAKLSGDDAPIKGRSLETGEEAGVERSTERGSNDTEELVNVLTSLDAVNILTSRVQAVSVLSVAEIPTVGVPTSSGLVPTVSAIFTTASVVTPYSRRKGKEKMVKSDTPKKKKIQEQIDVQIAREMKEQIAREDQRMNEQLVRDAEIAKIHAEELQMLIDGLDRNNEVIAKHLQEYEQSTAELTIGEKTDLINELVKYQDHHAKILKYQDFVPMASKEEGERFKRKGLRLEQGSAKKMKTSEAVSEEDLKEMMQLVPVEEVYVKALQVKHPIIDWEIHTEGKRDYWKIIRLGGNTTWVSDEEPKEDPKEDPADYPTDRADDDDDDEEEDEEEEEHLALADSTTLLVVDPISSVEDTEPFETDEYAPTPPRSPRLCRAGISVRLLPPMAASIEARIAEFKVGESSSTAASKQAGHTLAYRFDYGFIDTMDASIRASESKAVKPT
nr:hypothetical protein [Tanacetum cinerariifolium]